MELEILKKRYTDRGFDAILWNDESIAIGKQANFNF